MLHFVKQKMKHVQPLSWDIELAYRLFESLPHGISHFQGTMKNKVSDISQTICEDRNE